MSLSAKLSDVTHVAPNRTKLREEMSDAAPITPNRTEPHAKPSEAASHTPNRTKPNYKTSDVTSYFAKTDTLSCQPASPNPRHDTQFMRVSKTCVGREDGAMILSNGGMGRKLDKSVNVI